MNTFKAEVNKIILALTSVGIVILLMLPASLSASHFRYGTMSWEPVSDNGTHVTIRLKMELGWKRDYDSDSFRTVGKVVSNFVSINWGDGSNAEALKIKVLSSDSGNYASAANLQGYYRFNEGSGTSLQDNSSNSNTGTITGATWTAGFVSE